MGRFVCRNGGWANLHDSRVSSLFQVIKAFANIYLEAAQVIAAETRSEPFCENVDFPTVVDGLKGMVFIDAAVAALKPDPVGRRYFTQPESVNFEADLDTE